ncbi:MAG TPA: MFS transporter [Solirubrobacteraceae bacterium]|nr:MFS transporter [Solirubrobacteraceae bacterium]
MGSPLSSPRLRRIITAYTVNRLGSWIGLVALSLAVFDHTHSALAVAALLFAWQALPAFLVPVVVARVEASVRRGELSGLYFFEAVATAALAVLLWHFSLPAVLFIAALDGTAALAASALLRAEIARVARQEVEAQWDANVRPSGGLQRTVEQAERQANGALSVGFSAATVGGPVLGSVVVAAAGASAALFVDVGSFVICGVLLIDLHPHVEEAAGDSVRARLLAAWAHINEMPALRSLLLAEAVALTFIQAAGPIEVTYAKATLHAGDRGYGLLVTSWGAGAVLATLIFARSVQRRLGVMLSGGIFALGAAFVGFAIAPSLAFACIAAFVGGVGNGFEWPSLISLVQRMTPQPLHGRLMGAVESLAALCLAIGLPLGGILVALSSARIAFLIVGLAAVAATVAFIRLTATGLELGDAGTAEFQPSDSPLGDTTLPLPTEPATK